MSYPVKFFHSGMQGAPVLSNNWGDLIGVLDACLVTGFNLKAVDSITSTGGIATVSIPAGHLFKPDQIILITGCEQAQYNGEQKVISVTSNTLTYAVTGNPQSPATTQGTIQCKVAPLGWEKPFSGLNKAAYRSLDPASPRHFLRVDDGIKTASAGGTPYDTNWAKWANVGICENMTDIDTIVGAQAPFDPMNPEQNWKGVQNYHFGWYKWYHGVQAGYENYGDGGGGARNWVIVGDGRLFFFLTTAQAGYNWCGRVPYAFGDPISFKPGDTSSTILKAHDRYWMNQQYWSYFYQEGGASMMLELDWGGTTMLKNYTQVGNPIRWGLCTLNLTNGQKHCGRGGLPFPNGPDFALWMLPAYIRQEDGHLRGLMPGMRWLPQDRPYSDMAVIDGVVNEPGRKFILPRYHHSSETEYGQVAFDITGPWR